MLLAQAGSHSLQPPLAVKLLQQAAQLHGVAGSLQPLQQLTVSQIPAGKQGGQTAALGQLLHTMNCPHLFEAVL
jgi:hypothetical protein